MEQRRNVINEEAERSSQPGLRNWPHNVNAAEHIHMSSRAHNIMYSTFGS
jgi:hypothetical protein